LNTISTEIQANAPPKEEIVYVTDNGIKYHRNGCRYLKNSGHPIQLSEAKKKYTPCSVCDP